MKTLLTLLTVVVTGRLVCASADGMVDSLSGHWNWTLTTSGWGGDVRPSDVGFTRRLEVEIAASGDSARLSLYVSDTLTMEGATALTPDSTYNYYGYPTWRGNFSVVSDELGRGFVTVVTGGLPESGLVFSDGIVDGYFHFYEAASNAASQRMGRLGQEGEITGSVRDVNLAGRLVNHNGTPSPIAVHPVVHGALTGVPELRSDLWVAEP